MRPVTLPQPPFSVATASPEVRWLFDCLVAISNASRDAVTEEIADAYTVENQTETRTLDCDAATVTQLADVVGTILTDMKNRGVKRR